LSAYTVVYALGMSKVVPVREFRSNLSHLLNDVVDRKDHVLITRNGRPAAVLISIEEYESLEETVEILSDPEAMAALEEGLAELERGDTVSLEEVRRELAARRDDG
jgi:antitoxin YefM